MKAIRIEQTGGPQVLKIRDVPLPEPHEGQARVKHDAIGVNFIDIYHRSGLYPIPVPFTPGSEGAGVVDAVGPNVSGVKAGDRVVYAMHSGAYAEFSVVPAWKLVKIPDSISTIDAAAVFLQGLTVHYLTHGSAQVTSGMWVLIHAAAGGVGRMLVQICRKLGANIIGTVSSQKKADLSREDGAQHVVVYTETDFQEEVKKITAGRGVAIVYDSVGQDTFLKSVECLSSRGILVLFGQSSGPVAAFSPSLLAKNSLFLTRPSLAHYAATREELLSRSETLFRWIGNKDLKINMDATFPLDQASEAHSRLESRQSTGKILLIP